MKLAIGSAQRDGGNLAWFRKRAPSSLPLSELKQRLKDGRPVFEWSPFNETLEDEYAPFERIAEILGDADSAGVTLDFYEFDDAEDVSSLPDDLDEKRVTSEVALNLIDSWREDRNLEPRITS